MAQANQTFFAPAGRADAAELARQAALFSGGSVWRKMLDAVSDVVLVVNQERQIVFTNQALLTLMGLDDPMLLVGLRPGEALGCATVADARTVAGEGGAAPGGLAASVERGLDSSRGTADVLAGVGEGGAAPGGCGTGEACRYCGSAQALLAGLKGLTQEGECQITSHRHGQVEHLDLRVKATPLELQGSRFVIWTAQDISHEKRRRALERIFFHDVLNTAGGLKGFAELIKDSPPEEIAEFSTIIADLSTRLIAEIQNQKDLLAAESFELTPAPATFRADEFLDRLRRSYAAHEAAKEKQLVLDSDCAPVSLTSDPVLLQRVLGNMLKNALEASQPGQTVTMGCRLKDEEVEFWVHNPDPIPRPVQVQVFKRSFSTKGLRRGLGTYSMKLLSERYLKGQVGFTTSPEAGTTFFARYPMNLAA